MGTSSPSSSSPTPKKQTQKSIKNEKSKELPILPNYADNFSLDTQKIKLKCNVNKQDPNQKTTKLKFIILNDRNIEKLRNYIKEHYRFKQYIDNKNLVDKLILSRNDIDRNKYRQVYHDLEDYNLYAEIVDTFNYQIFNEKEINNIKNILEKINKNIEYEINQFIDLCFFLITEYVKFFLVKIAKFNQCQKCGTKCLYILFHRDQRRIVDEGQSTSEDLERGIRIIRNLLDDETEIKKETIIENSIINVIYLNGIINKNELEIIEKNTAGTVLYIKKNNKMIF